MAVPTGDYEVRVSLDLSPLAGKIESSATVTVNIPPADQLDRRLKELDSTDAAVRRNALLDLRYFPKDGVRVVPALVSKLSDSDATIRNFSLSTLSAFPAEAAEHVDLYLKILDSKEEQNYIRMSAMWLVSRVAPASPEVEAALRKAWETADENQKPQYESALQNYQRRTNPKAQ